MHARKQALVHTYTDRQHRLTDSKADRQANIPTDRLTARQTGAHIDTLNPAVKPTETCSRTVAEKAHVHSSGRMKYRLTGENALVDNPNSDEQPSSAITEGYDMVKSRTVSLN